MGRSNEGKKQEDAQTATNTANQAADRTGRDASVGSYNASVDNLEANPGIPQAALDKVRGFNQNVTHAVYGSAMDAATRHAGIIGNANDAGLSQSLDTMARNRAMAEAESNGATDTMNANAIQSTRMAIPGFRMAPAQLYQTGNTAALNSNTSLINSRMEQDSKPTFLQQMALGGIQAAGQAAGGYLANPSRG